MLKMDRAGVDFKSESRMEIAQGPGLFPFAGCAIRGVGNLRCV
jgi:hypothetical protein